MQNQTNYNGYMYLYTYTLYLPIYKYKPRLVVAFTHINVGVWDEAFVFTCIHTSMWVYMPAVSTFMYAVIVGKYKF